MKTLVHYPLALMLTFLSFTSLEAWADPFTCSGYPNQEFNNRLGHEMETLIQTVRCRDLERALHVVRQMDQELRMEIARGGNGGGTEYGECYEDRNCKARLSQTTPTKGMCSASGGHSWKKTNPLPVGSCELVR
jgi:hypothetical protein